MTKRTEADFKLSSQRLDALPTARRIQIEAGARAIVANMHLAEVRKALDITQTVLATRTGMKQAELSRIENNTENVQLKTLNRYVAGLGGTCKIVAEFPDGVVAEIPMRAGKLVKSKITAEAKT